MLQYGNMELVGANNLTVPTRQITVPHPVVSHREFVDFAPDEVEISKIRRGQAWYQLVKLFSIDRLGIHGLSTIKTQFGGQEAPKTPLEFNEFPAVEPGRFIDREQVDGLSVPTLRTFVDQVSAELNLSLAPARQKEMLDRRMGSNVGIVILKFWDVAATHFGAPVVTEQPPVSVA